MRSNQFFQDETTIGYYIASSVNYVGETQEIYEDIGNQFLKHNRVEDSDAHVVMKKVNAGLLDMKVAEFIINCDVFNEPLVSKEFIEIPAQRTFCIKFRIFKNVTNSSEPLAAQSLAVREFADKFNTFVELNLIESFAEGAGRAAIQKLLINFKNVPVFLEAGIAHYGDCIAVEKGTMKDATLLNRLLTYYQSLDFVDVNKDIKTDNSKIVMMNLNKARQVFVNDPYFAESLIRRTSKVHRSNIFG